MLASTPQSDARIHEAIQLKDGGHIDQAIAILRRAAAADFDNVRLSLILGSMLAEADDLKSAERWFRRIVRLAPDDLSVRLNLGTFLGQTGRHADARRVLLGVAAEIEAGSYAAGLPAGSHLRSFVGATYVNLGRIELECGNYALARAYVEPLLSHPDVWSSADSIMLDLVTAEDVDPTEAVFKSVIAGQASPPMVAFVIESLLSTPRPPYNALADLIGSLEQRFEFDWADEAPGLAEMVAAARAAYGRAVMRGEIDAQSGEYRDEAQPE